MSENFSTEHINQRETYKLVEKLSSGKYKDELRLLKSLVRDIVDYPDFEINGGRIWELNPEKKTYELRYQYGNVKKIPSDYSIDLKKQKSLFTRLTKERIFLQRETDEVLLEKGVKIYSVTAVGNIIRVGKDKYYQYAIGFNAKEILQSFFETLTVISSVATVALRNLSSKAAQEKISKDIYQASEIQRNLLPEHDKVFHDFKIFGVCIPDSAVGGDYFDYFDQPGDEDERLGIVISDAASKGLPAAIQALFVSGAIRMGKSFSTKISHLIAQLNTLIFDTFPYERFVTLFYCELTNSSNRLVLYANAGHCEPIHYRPETGNVKILESTGGLLGLVQHQKFQIENVRMHPGDILVLYTDGITEAHSAAGEMFGEERLIEVIKRHHKKSPRKIAYAIIEAVQRFSINSNITDDRTLVVIKRDPKD